MNDFILKNIHNILIGIYIIIILFITLIVSFKFGFILGVCCILSSLISIILFNSFCGKMIFNILNERERKNIDQSNETQFKDEEKNENKNDELLE